MSYDFHFHQGTNLQRIAALQKAVVAYIDTIDWTEDPTRSCSRTWLMIHLQTCAQIARILAMRRGVDVELVVAAALLHDLGYVVNNGASHGHAKHGIQPAREMLERVGGFTDDEISLIVDAVGAHSDKDTIGTPLQEIIKDADVLDCSLHGLDFTEHEYHVKRYSHLISELGLNLLSFR